MLNGAGATEQEDDPYSVSQRPDRKGAAQNPPT